MSLSVERLKELEQMLKLDVELSEVRFRSAISESMALKRSRDDYDKLLAIRELIALKEAEPVAYAQFHDSGLIAGVVRMVPHRWTGMPNAASPR